MQIPFYDHYWLSYWGLFATKIQLLAFLYYRYCHLVNILWDWAQNISSNCKGEIIFLASNGPSPGSCRFHSQCSLKAASMEMKSDKLVGVRQNWERLTEVISSTVSTSSSCLQLEKASCDAVSLWNIKSGFTDYFWSVNPSWSHGLWLKGRYRSMDMGCEHSTKMAQSFSQPEVVSF